MTSKKRTVSEIMKTEQLEEVEKKSKVITVWIESILNEKLPKNSLRENLIDGVVLCKIVNALAPGALKRFHKKPRMLAMKIENIGFFLATCKSRLNLPPALLFQPTDLHDDNDNLNSMRKVLNVLSFIKGDGESEFLKEDEDDDLEPSSSNTAPEDTEHDKTESNPKVVAHEIPVATEKASEGNDRLDTDWYLNGTKSDYVDVQDEVLSTILKTINVELTVETKRKLLRRLQNQITFIEEKIMTYSDEQLRDLAHSMGLGETIEDIPKGKSRDWTVEFILKYGRAK